MFWIVWSPSPHHWVLWSGIPFKRVLWERKALDSARGASAVGVVAASGLPPVALPGLVGPQTVQVEIHSNNRLLWNKQMLIASIPISHLALLPAGRYPSCAGSTSGFTLCVDNWSQLFWNNFTSLQHFVSKWMVKGWPLGLMNCPKSSACSTTVRELGSWSELSWMHCTFNRCCNRPSWLIIQSKAAGRPKLFQLAQEEYGSAYNIFHPIM